MPKAGASRLQGWWREPGFPADQLHTAVTLTRLPVGGGGPAYARTAMAHVREAVKYLLSE